MIPFGDWLPDLPDYGTHLTTASNVIPAASSYRSFPSMAEFSTALNNTCVGAVAVKANGTPSNFAGTASKLYLLSGMTYTDVSKVGDYTGGSESRWNYGIYGNRLIATNYSDYPQSYTVGTSTAFADLTTTFKAKYIGMVREFTVFANTFDATDGALPNQVWWSAINNPTDYTPSVSTQADKQQLFGDGELGEITGFVGGEYGTVFFEGGIFRMTYVGAPVIFSFDQIISGAGCVAPCSIASYGGMIFYLGGDGFYMLQGTQTVPIGNNKVDKWFAADLDKTLTRLASAVIDPVNSLYIMAYPGAGNSGSCNKLIIFNWLTGRWSSAEPGNMEVLINSMSQAVDPDSASAESTYGNPDTGAFADVSVDARIFVGGALQLSALNASHKLAYFNSAALDAALETAETQLFPARRSLVRNVRPMVEGGSAMVMIGVRDTTAGTVSYSAPVAVNEYGEANMLVSGRYLRARTIIQGGFEHAYGLDYEASPQGKY